MAKFSLDRDEDGEGPSTSARKRLRISIQSDFVDGGNQEQFEEEEEGNESDEDKGDEDIYEEEEYSEGEASEEEENSEEPQRCQEDSFVSAGPRSNVGGQLCRDGSITVTLTDPEVLDCTICYEPLSSPVFQVPFHLFSFRCLFAYIFLIGNSEVSCVLVWRFYE